MMRTFALSVVACFALAAVASAANLTSGPQQNEGVGAFEVKKVAGNDHDGVKAGQELCYRCMLGMRPVVAIFSRNPNEKLSRLMKEVDAVVDQNGDKKMAAFVNLLGDDDSALEAAAKKIVDNSGAENIAVVVPKDQPNGPASYKINPEAETTVLIYVKAKVVANHALPAGALDDETISKIVDDTAKILN
ncbi:MAG: hypothetical protein IT427_09755 [Pirellulales bacterium]|nr:hypothetical protein [Pirellulales bacterium]